MGIRYRMKKNTRKTTDALEILDHLFVKNDPEMQQMIEEDMANAEIARNIYDLRTQANLTQQQLAKLIGTSRSVITRLEDADYEGHSLSMLRRIAKALHKEVRIEFVPFTNGKVDI